MDEGSERAIQRVGELIEAYLAQHPQAADDEQGIAQWWLPAMGADVPLEQVRSALDVLVRCGAVVRAVLPGGPVIYRSAIGRRAPAGNANEAGGQAVRQGRNGPR